MSMFLVRLRIELWTAAQTLKGADLEEFWALLDELHRMRAAELADPDPEDPPEPPAS